MHPGLVLHGPCNFRFGVAQRCFVFLIRVLVNAERIMPDYIYITLRRGWGAAVKMIPYGVPNEASPDPSIGKVQRTDQTEKVPTELVGPQYCNDL